MVRLTNEALCAAWKGDGWEAEGAVARRAQRRAVGFGRADFEIYARAHAALAGFDLRAR